MVRLYKQGAEDALEVYGVRVAHELRRRMPTGPAHLPAERLAKALSDADDFHGKRNKTPYKLDKDVRWGSPSSLEAAGSGAYSQGPFNIRGTG